MRLVGIDEAWEQYTDALAHVPAVPKESVFIFEGDTLVAGCVITDAEAAMFASRVVVQTDEGMRFMLSVLRAHGKVTNRKVMLSMGRGAADRAGLRPSSVYELAEEETPQARKKETDPGETPHAEPTDQGGTGEDVPSEVAESKPRAWRKKVKK